MKSKTVASLFLLVLIACMSLVIVSCSSEKYPVKYVLTSESWERLIDFAITSENISEEELALYGGRDGIKNLLVSEIGDISNAFSVTLTDKENIRAVYGGDTVETTYEISGSDIFIIQTGTGNKVLLGTLSKDKKSLSLNTLMTGFALTLYKSE